MRVIYNIKNTVNGKLYIGSSSQYTFRRRGHLSLLRRNKHHSIHLQNAWNKYGADSFEFSVIECILTTDRTYLIEREQYWMDTLQSYNQVFGYNISNIAQSSNRTAIPILQYSLDGKFIKEWRSIQAAAIFYNTKDSSIGNLCKDNSRYKHIAGYQWRYKTKNYPLQIESNLKLYYYIDSSNNINVFNSLQEASISTGFLKGNIRRSTIHNVKCGGYYWYISDSYNICSPLLQ